MMSNKRKGENCGKHYDKQFKEDALQYREDHPELTFTAVCRNLGISVPTFYNWHNQAKQNDGVVDHIGSEKRELKNKEDALQILKKSNGYFGKKRTLVLYECVRKVESRISFKGVLSELNTSTSSYYEWKKRKPSKQTKRQERIEEQIVKIHEESYKIYGAHKITEVLRSKGYSIAQRTVSKYINEEGIKAHCTNHIQRQAATVTLQAN